MLRGIERCAPLMLAWLVLVWPVQGLAGPSRSHLVTASDGIKVHVYEYAPASSSGAAPLIMFHQGDSDARAELGPIAEQFAKEGMPVFTADLRSGGNKFGGTNATVAAIGKSGGMCEAYADVLATLDFVVAKTGKPVILLGSSYSAALVAQAAANRADKVAGFVSLSPASGAPIAGCEPEPWLAKLTVPGLGIRPRREIEAAPWIKAQAETWEKAGVPMQVFDVPAHGASMLVSARGGAESLSVQRAVRTFIDSLGNDQRVEIQSGDWKLNGDFRQAPGAGKRPVALLLNRAAGDRSAYAHLAGELARRGVSSLRLDLRGHGESINKGRFVPFDSANNAKIFVDGQLDVLGALAWLRSNAAVDVGRIAIVGASYSGELAVDAARREGAFVRAYALLSPGSLSLESAQGMEKSGARWLFVRSESERSPSVRAAAENVAAHAPSATIRVVDGDKHATDILANTPAFTPWLADWLASTLGD